MFQDPKNKIYKIKISVSGFTKEQIVDGLPFLLDEFNYRPWLLEAEAYFDETSGLLIVIVGSEIDFRLEDGMVDEVSDCVIATMNFNEKVSFDVARI